MTMKYVKFLIPSSIDKGWKILEENGIEPLYSEETPEGFGEIYTYLPESLLHQELPFEWLEVQPPSVDWTAQWKAHAKGYENGMIKIPIPGYGDVMLTPGPGFGDLSHPSTRLILQLLPVYVKGRCVVDVGCGSGILSLCAAAYGADPVYGIDISPEALSHSLENRILNKMETVTFLMPEDLMFVPAPPVILMNMIRSEQQEAWEALPQLHPLPGLIITSGILSSEREDYLYQTESWGWLLKDIAEEDGWSCFVFDK